MALAETSRTEDEPFRRSAELFERASRVIPGGVTSAARRRATPVMIRRASGSRVVMEDGAELIDLVLGLGPILLGHAAEPVLSAARAQLGRGESYGASHAGEADLARRIIRLVPGIERVLLLTTGSEAVHAALRVARVSTGRSRIVKFEGHYHGWLDPLYVNAPGVAAGPAGRGPVPAVGNTEGCAESADVTVARWHDLADLERAFRASSDPVAAVIMEPIPFNFGTVLPDVAYLRDVRRLCDRTGAMLIFDEVVSGFRLGLGGAQELLDVRPDLTILAKAIAAGYPLSALGGSMSAMRVVEQGRVRPAGTANGSPIAVAAAVATLAHLEQHADDLYPRMEHLGERLAEGLRAAAEEHRVPLVVQQIGSVLQLLWNPRMPVRAYADAAAGDAGTIAALAEALLWHGVLCTPRGLMLLCAAHTDDEIDHVVAACASVLSEMGETDPNGATPKLLGGPTE